MTEKISKAHHAILKPSVAVLASTPNVNSFACLSRQFIMWSHLPDVSIFLSCSCLTGPFPARRAVPPHLHHTSFQSCAFPSSSRSCSAKAPPQWGIAFCSDLHWSLFFLISFWVFENILELKSYYFPIIWCVLVLSFPISL